MTQQRSNERTDHHRTNDVLRIPSLCSRLAYDEERGSIVFRKFMPRISDQVLTIWVVVTLILAALALTVGINYAT